MTILLGQTRHLLQIEKIATEVKMNDYSPTDNSKTTSSISIGGAIVFAVIAFFGYGAWTKTRTDNCLQNIYELYKEEWANTCKSLAEVDKKRDGSPGCSLPRVLVNELENRLQKSENFCVSYG
ncbi:hypothetical protein [Legionella waltersii]|nr:hypothetical protein [Legionella waltersii]